MSEALRVLSPVPAVLQDLPVRIDRDEVLRFQGYKRGVDLPTAEVLALFDEAVALGERLWGRLASVGAGICTIGDVIETRVSALFEAREFPLAVMLDSVGSAAVESLAEYANDLLCQAALPEGLQVTNRISPGYAGWDTAEQAALFRLCPGGPIGVTLNDACFMTPTKSISFLVGLGPDARVDHYFTQCRRCWMRDCAYRRAPAPVTVHR